MEGRGGGGMLLSETVNLEKEIETDPLICLSVEKSIIPHTPTQSVPLPFYSPTRKGRKQNISRMQEHPPCRPASPPPRNVDLLVLLLTT